MPLFSSPYRNTNIRPESYIVFTINIDALTTPQKASSFWKLFQLKMLDFSDRTRTGNSILTSAADSASRT